VWRISRKQADRLQALRAPLTRFELDPLISRVTASI
jgi:hypothetical protein